MSSPGGSKINISIACSLGTHRNLGGSRSGCPVQLELGLLFIRWLMRGWMSRCPCFTAGKWVLPSTQAQLHGWPDDLHESSPIWRSHRHQPVFLREAGSSQHSQQRGGSHSFFPDTALSRLLHCTHYRKLTSWSRSKGWNTESLSQGSKYQNHVETGLQMRRAQVPSQPAS